MSPPKPSDLTAQAGSRRVPVRVILIQLGVLAGLAAFYKLYLPHRERARAAAEAQVRELRIAALFQSLVTEDASAAMGGIGAPGEGSKQEERGAALCDSRRPQRLTRTPSVAEVERALGLPEQRSTDFRGGLHLTWTGTVHKLEASFDRGRLYCLRLEDQRTGHGELVFESSFAWHPF